jgi:hypothetical protein
MLAKEFEGESFDLYLLSLLKVSHDCYRCLLFQKDYSANALAYRLLHA